MAPFSYAQAAKGNGQGQRPDSNPNPQTPTNTRPGQAVLPAQPSAKQQEITSFFKTPNPQTPRLVRVPSPNSPLRKDALGWPQSTSAPIAFPQSAAPPSSTAPKAPVPSTSKNPTLTLTEHKGDIFAAPDNAVLIHACNTLGSWGAGIAAAFRTKYPNAYKIYYNHCAKKHNPDTNPVPIGTCLLIPPVEHIQLQGAPGGAPGGRGRGGLRGGRGGGRGGHAGRGGVRGGRGGAAASAAPAAANGPPPKHWIACLFTSAKFGKNVSTPEQILAQTGPAMRDLLRQIDEPKAAGRQIGELRMCKINSGLFNVPWEDTVAVLQGIEAQGEDGKALEVEVWSID